MKLHILGICGTFMAGVAQIARELGHEVTGSDANTFPPMSTLLASLDIEVSSGYDPRNIPSGVDLCIVGNAMTRGNPEVEHMLDAGVDFMSGPEWLHRHALRGRRVIAVAGTHGKTTTSSMVCRIIDFAGHDCGFLVGGMPGNFDVSARLGSSPWFAIEADEYDSAFFDKRSKFVHYHPRIAVINNIEFDHGDIFRDVEDIKTQFHHLVRTIPGSGTIVYNADDANIDDTLERGCWSHLEPFSLAAGGDGWRIESHDDDYSAFSISGPGGVRIAVDWSLFGAHNAANALAAAAACTAAGIGAADIGNALAGYHLPRRRLQLIAESAGIRIYEDFAHHPTAIARTFDALLARYPDARLVAALEPRSNTMRSGVHNAALGPVLGRAAQCLLLPGPDLQWDPTGLVDADGNSVCRAFGSADEILQHLERNLRPGDVLVLLSNGAFGGLPALVARTFAARGEPADDSTVNRVHPASRNLNP